MFRVPKARISQLHPNYCVLMCEPNLHLWLLHCFIVCGAFLGLIRGSERNAGGECFARSHTIICPASYLVAAIAYHVVSHAGIWHILRVILCCCDLYIILCCCDIYIILCCILCCSDFYIDRLILATRNTYLHLHYPFNGYHHPIVMPFR